MATNVRRVRNVAETTCLLDLGLFRGGGERPMFTADPYIPVKLPTCDCKTAGLRSGLQQNEQPMSYNIDLPCGCVVYVSCHPVTGIAHTRIIQQRSRSCPRRHHEVGARLFLWEMLPDPAHATRPVWSEELMGDQRVAFGVSPEGNQEARSMADKPARWSPRDLFPTEDEIAQLAYDKFFHDDRADWRYADCYRRAEDELLQRAARRAIPDCRVRRPR